jgi:hypothetical protein
VEKVLQRRPLLVLLLGPSLRAGAPRGGAPRSQMYGRQRGKMGAPISSRSGRRRPAPGEGPQRRPLGLGGGNGNRRAEGSWVGAPECSTKRRRWVGTKGNRGRAIGRRERRRRSRMVCFGSSIELQPPRNQKAINQLIEI